MYSLAFFHNAFVLIYRFSILCFGVSAVQLQSVFHHDLKLYIAFVR